jgi:hypothetical protein
MNEKKSKGISRREFARRAALASAVASIAPAVAGASVATGDFAPGAASAAPDSANLATANLHPASSSGSSAAAAPAQQPANLPKLSPESQAEVEARLQSILTQYGSRFSEEQKADLRRLCHLAQAPLDRLRAYTVDNGVNPALYLKPLVEREKNPLEDTRKGKTPTGATKKS